MSYTECNIGGVDMFVDPDTVNEGIRPYAKVVPSLDGTIFLHHLSTNPSNIGSNESINISGVYLPTTSITQLKGLVRSRSLVKVKGVPAIEDDVDFIILDMQQNPIKPAVIFPGEDIDNPTVRHGYTLVLQKVTDS